MAVLLLLTLDPLPAGCSTVVEILHALASNGKIVKQLLLQGTKKLQAYLCQHFFTLQLDIRMRFHWLTGGILYLLNLFCNSSNPDVRQQTAELFAKLISDKLNGPKVNYLHVVYLLTHFTTTLFLPRFVFSLLSSSPLFSWMRWGTPLKHQFTCLKGPMKTPNLYGMKIRGRKCVGQSNS